MCTGLVSVGLFRVSHHAGKLVTTLCGHEGAVNSVAYSSDGLLLASASSDGTVRIWDMRTGEEMMSPLRGEDGAVWSVAIAPDCKSVVLGTESGSVRTWRFANTHIPVQRVNGHSAAVSSVSYSPNGCCLASGSLDHTVRLWNVETPHRPIVLKGHTDKVHTLAFSPDSLALATGSEDQTIHIWDVTTGKLRYKSPQHHEKPIRSLCFLSDGQKIAAGSGDGIILCKLRTERSAVLLHSSSSHVLSVNSSSDGNLIVSAYGKSVCISTLPRFRVKTTSLILGGHTETVLAAAFSHNCLYIASASTDHTIRIWSSSRRLKVQPAAAHEATDNEPVSALFMSDSRVLTGHSRSVSSIAVSPDSMVIVSGSTDRSVRIWDAQTGAAMLPPLLGHTGGVHSVAISSDGRLIASGSLDNTVRLWDMQKGKAVGQNMQGHSDAVNAVVFSPDARWLASGSNDKTVRIWDVATQQASTVGPLFCHNAVLTVAISPNGRLVAAGDDGGYICIWQIETGQPAREPLHTHLSHVNSIAFSPDETFILSSGRHSRERAQIWNIDTGEQALTLNGHSKDVYSAVYSPDGRFIGTGADDMTVRIWDAVTGVPVAVLAGHNSTVWSVAFTPDSRSIVSGSADNMIRFWDRTRATIACPASDDYAATPLHVSIQDNGWLQTPSGELVLWVPTEYHSYLYTPRGSPRVAIAFENSGWHRGESWTACWRSGTTDPSSHVL